MSASRDQSSFGASSFANRRFQEYEREKERNDAFAANFPNHLIQSNQNPTSNPNIQQHHHYNYVTNEEFALLKRSIERDRLHRDDLITKLKKEVLDLKERAGELFAATDDETQQHQQQQRGQHQKNSTTTNISTSNNPNVFMSSPPKRFGLFAGNSKSFSSENLKDHQTPEEQLSHHLTLQSRVEHLEASTLALPVRLDAIEEKCRTIVEERLRQVLNLQQAGSGGMLTQLGDLTNKIEALSSRQNQSEVIQTDISNMLEHDVARNAPIKQNMDEIKLDAVLLKKEVDTLHSQRLASEDTRVKLENEVRALRTHVAELETVLSGKMELEIAKLGTHREGLTENLVDRKLLAERNHVKEFLRSEMQKLREESLEAQNKVRIDFMNSKKNNSPPPSENSIETSSPENDHNSKNQNSNHLFNLLSEQIQAKGRQLEATLNVALSDSNRALESKFSTRIREQAEANRALISEEMSQRMDLQFSVMLNTAKEELRHELSQQLEAAVRRESEKLTRKQNFEQQQQSSHNNSGIQINNNDADEENSASGAPDVIFDGIELFVREIFSKNNSSKVFLSSQQQTLYSQCLELISSNRESNSSQYGNGGRIANSNEALLLLWTFLRSHLSGFNILADSVGKLSQDFTLVSQHQKEQQQNSESAAIVSEEDQEILNTVFDDVDAVVTQFSQVNDSFASCGEFLEKIVNSQNSSGNDNSNNVSSAQVVQVLWLFMRGMLSLFTMMNERIDRI